MSTDINMEYPAFDAVVTARAQRSDVIYLTDGAFTINGVPYMMNSQHIYRHDDGSWHHFSNGKRFGHIYAYRYGNGPLTGSEPTTAAYKKITKWLEAIGAEFEQLHGELLEDAEYDDVQDQIAKRQERIEQHCKVADDLAGEIRALEKGGRQEYKDKHYSNGYKEESVAYIVTPSETPDVFDAVECVKDCGAR